MARQLKQRARWPGWAAGVWVLLFAAPNFYWAAGGTAFQQTIAADVDAALGGAADPAVVALTGVGKVVVGLLPLALISSRTLLRWRVLRAVTALLGAGIVLYGVANLVQHALMVIEVIETPAALGREAAHWHLLFWDPLWLLGGLLFLLAARSAQAPMPAQTRRPPEPSG